jgi:hypothetical protein
MKQTLAVAAILLAAGGVSTLAHHPFDAEYDWKKPVTITGTVTKLEWKNPHAALTMKGKDDSGAESDWMVELGSPATLQRAGWTSKQLRAGEQITVDGWLAKDGSKWVSGKSVTPSGGHELFAAGAFFDRAASGASGRTHGAAATTGTTSTGTKPTNTPKR